MYENASVPVREDIESIHSAIWSALGRPGTWWTAAQRIGIAREARRARAERGLAPVPSEPVEPTLPAIAVDVARRIGGDPASLDEVWFGDVRDRLSDAEYVELAAIVVQTVSVDVFCRGLGLPLHAYPEPAAGEPSYERPVEAVEEEAWVPTVPAGEAGGEVGAALYRGEPMPNVIRALSLVPADAELAIRQCEAQYLEIPQVTDPGFDPGRGLSRPQIELIAGRVSAINQCFY